MQVPRESLKAWIRNQSGVSNNLKRPDAKAATGELRQNYAGGRGPGPASVAVGARLAKISIGPLWCMNGLVAASVRQAGDQQIRAEAGMPKLVIQLSTLHPIFASVPLRRQSSSLKSSTLARGGMMISASGW
jgi:hypothetical protein